MYRRQSRSRSVFFVPSSVCVRVSMCSTVLYIHFRSILVLFFSMVINNNVCVEVTREQEHMYFNVAARVVQLSGKEA